MTDWIEQYYQSKREKQAQKGGPGSGHHGHAGRPGKRGGSVPGKGVGADASAHYRNLGGEKEAEAWQQEHYGGWADEADWDELEVIESYTGDGYAEVNKYLRGKPIIKSEREREAWEKGIKWTVERIDKTLERIKTPEAIVLHRGACPRERCVERFSQLKPGDEFVDKAYTSTSIFDHPKFDYRHVQIKINVPAGSSGLAIPDTASKNRGEWEFLLPRGSKYRVRDTGTRDGKLYLELDLIGRE